MTLSSAAYSYEAAASVDERRHSKQPSHNCPEASTSKTANDNTSRGSKSKKKEKKRFSLLRRLSSKKPNNGRESKTKKSKSRRFNPESSAPATWPGNKAGRRRSSLQSDMSGHTWLSSGTNGDSSRSLAGQGDHLNRGGANRGTDQHNQITSGRHAQKLEEGAAAADNDEEPFQDSLGDLSAALPGLALNHDSRSRLAGSDCANDGSHGDGTSISDNDDDEMFRTAHGEENGMVHASDDDVDGMSSNEDITASFLSCIAETLEGGHGISSPSTSPQQQHHHHPDDAADTTTDGKPTARPIHQAPKEQEQEADTTCTEVAEGPPTNATSTTTQRRKSVEFKDVVSYATVANKKFLSDDELFVLFYSVEEETELRHQLKSEIRAVKASPNPARTHPTFCRRGVAHYFLPREGRQARLASQHNVIDAVLDEQHVQFCERGEIYDDSAIAIVSIEASRDARLDALVRGGSDETEAILIRREDDEAAASTGMKQGDGVRVHRPTRNEPILKGRRRASDEGALCA